MFIQTIPENLKSNLESLGKESTIVQFYLAGGTALALQLGHRVSRDLDFFTQSEFSADALIPVLQSMGKLTIDTLEKHTILGYLNDVRISFFFYPYPLLLPTIPFLGIHLADIPDIGVMKLNAIQDRGKKRDFIDLFALLKKGISLEVLFSHFEKKYAGVQYNKQHLLKSLTYFADAEGDEMPEMLKKCSWKDVKQYIEEAVKTFSAKHI